MAVKVSVVVAVYNPGDNIQRLLASLDAQSLPVDEFEVVFVDDGSTDETPERLRAFAAGRPNVSVTTIPNSGWPGRPRNVAPIWPPATTSSTPTTTTSSFPRRSSGCTTWLPPTAPTSSTAKS